MIDVPFITNEKVFLRPAELQDVPMFQRCSNLPEVRYALFTAFPENRVRLNEWVEGLYKNHDSIVLVMVDNDTKRAVGYTAYYRIDWVSRAAVFFIAIADPDDWSHGYGGKTVQMMMDYAFYTLNLQRIQLHVWVDNEKAVKAYEKVGFKIEGTLRRAMYHKGKYADFHVMGLLKDEYAPNADKV